MSTLCHGGFCRENKLSRPGHGWFLPVGMGVLVADQISKVWIERLLLPGCGIQVLPGLFSLTRVHNTGVAFGMAQGNNLLTGILALGILGLSAWVAKSWDWKKEWVQVVAALVAGGAVGNLMDRMRLGYVLDFLDFHYAGWSWPAFNVADSAISVGVTLLVLSWLAGRSPEAGPRPGL